MTDQQKLSESLAQLSEAIKKIKANEIELMGSDQRNLLNLRHYFRLAGSI